jgi:hypothetical protein
VCSSLLNRCSEKKNQKEKKVYDVQKMVLGVRNPQSIACEVWSLSFPGFRCNSLIISLYLCDIVSVIHYDVTICMKLDPGIHIGSTWFSSENRV